MQCPSCGNACSSIDFEEFGACQTCYDNWTASHDDVVGDDPLLNDQYDDDDYDYETEEYPFYDYEDDGRYDDSDVYAW